MIKYCKQNNEIVLAQIKRGNLDYAHLSSSNLVDDIIREMNTRGVLQSMEDGIQDLRASNQSIPFRLILGFIIAAKMKHRMSLTDIPFAITDHKLLGGLGYNLVDAEGNLGASLMTESGLRYLVEKYNPFDLFTDYNKTVQQFIMPKLEIAPNIHILDCTKIEVNLKNPRYEWSTIGVDKDGNKARGYKLANLRGIAYDTGFIEDVRFGQISAHDFELSRDMLLNSPVLKSGDILICDRGFVDRNVLNALKMNRGVDVYEPLKKNMESYQFAVSIAKLENQWESHPNKKRCSQRIAFVQGIGQYWSKRDNDVDINACVVWDKAKDDYYVFITTDLNKSAREIIKTYELRPEIEEQYRQIKEYWGLEEFKSTKLSVIAFHIVFTLFAYLFYELYAMSPEGQDYQGKSLPVLLKNYTDKKETYIVLYSGSEFAIISLADLLDIYSGCIEVVKSKIKVVISMA